MTTSLDLVSVANPRVRNDRSALRHDAVTLPAARSDDLGTFGNNLGQTTFIRVKLVSLHRHGGVSARSFRSFALCQQERQEEDLQKSGANFIA